jgi:stringent starvation protein B
MSEHEPSSTKPYLIRAIHEWCLDNGYTPYLAVAVDENTVVPREYVKAGEIVLNVSVLATGKLSLGNEWIEFQARFGGVARQISVPVGQVTAIYARETGQGMAFEVDKPLAFRDEAHEGGDTSAEGNASAPRAPVLAAVSPASEHTPPDDPPPDRPHSAGGRPRFKVVK